MQLNMTQGLIQALSSLLTKASQSLFNTTSRTCPRIRSAISCQTGDGVAGLAFLVHKGDEFIEARFNETPPFLAKSRVRTLKPNKYVRHKIDLLDTYGALKPGRYRVTVKYRTGERLEREYGITAMSFERTLMWIEVVGKDTP